MYASWWWFWSQDCAISIPCNGAVKNVINICYIQFSSSSHNSLLKGKIPGTIGYLGWYVWAGLVLKYMLCFQSIDAQAKKSFGLIAEIIQDTVISL